MTKPSESVLFLFSPPMQACYSLSSAPTGTLYWGGFLSEVIQAKVLLQVEEKLFQEQKNSRSIDQICSNYWSIMVFSLAEQKSF